MDNIEKDDFAEIVLNNFMDLYVIPEIEKRQEQGIINKPFALGSCQVIFHPDGSKPTVRLNQEIKAILVCKKKKGVAFKKNDFINENDIENINCIKLVEDEESTFGHFTCVHFKGRKIFSFDFRYNKGLSQQHIETAEQFILSAEECLKKQMLNVFIDNLFSAAELLAKSIVLLHTGVNLAKKSSHKSIQIKFNQFASHGNIDLDQKNAFNRLAQLRRRARYLQEDLDLSGEYEKELLADVKKLLSDAKSYCGTR